MSVGIQAFREDAFILSRYLCLLRTLRVVFMHFNAIIIGGGLGGLTAGATLSRFGKKVLLLEQHYEPGGCAMCFRR